MKEKIKIIFMILAFHCLAVSLFSQTITLNVSNVTVKDAIVKFKEKSGYSFVFEVSDLDMKKIISVSASRKPIEEVVRQILVGQSVTYEIKEKNIVITLQKATVPPQKLKSKKITGIVTDESNVPIIGASIIESISKNGTITDIDGRFTLEVIEQSTIKISYIGYSPSEVKIGNQQNLQIQLSADVKLLDDLVVIGYGVVRKSDLTGSVASIKTDEFNKSTATLEQSLIGHTPGVEIKQTSGAPGAGTTIRVRGVNSVYGGVEPLYVIDGFPASKDVYINPSDVASIDVLKDAASAAIYGSRASGGVVLITTKRGSKDKTKVEIDYQFSMQELSNKIDMMNAAEFKQLHMDGYNNNYFDHLRINNIYGSNEERWMHSRQDDEATRKTNGASNTMILAPDIMNSVYDTDWQDEIFSSAPMSRTNVNISGGKEGHRYMFSLGYLDQDGIIAPSTHSRITSRLNMDIDVTKRLSIGVNSSMFCVSERTVRSDGLAFNDGIILNTLGMPSQYPVYNEDGSFATGWSFRNSATTYNLFGGENPVALANLNQQYYTRSRYSLNADLRYKIADGLIAKVNAGLQIADQIYRYYRPAEILGQSNYAPGNFENLARSANNRDFNTDWLMEATLSYNKTFNDKHNINAVGGYSMQKKVYDNIDAAGRGYKNDRIPELSGAGPTATDENGTSAVTDRSAWSLMSFFGRLMYNYDSRYTMSLTLRTDGCSRFGQVNRWGSFPSLSAGWNVSNEEFFEPMADVLSLKVRGSWGVSGNNNIGNYRHIPLIANGTYNFGSATAVSYYPSGFTDLELGWERTNQTNIGLDMGFFNGRINLIANYYYSVTNDLLYNTTVSAMTGSTNYWTNLHQGEVYNNGFDFQVDGNIIAKKDLKWNAGFNISMNRNKVMGLEDEITSVGQRSQITHITRNGLPVGSYYGMVGDGIITAADYANISIDKLHQNEVGYKLLGPPVANYDDVYIGDVKWKDVNNNGKITEDDRDIIGSNYPDFTFGINTTLNWKGLSFSTTFDGQYGAEVINFSRYYINNLEGGVNSMTISNNRYRDETNPGDGQMFRANRVAKNLNTKFSTYFVEDASFLRCTNISLGYTFPQNSLLKNLTISNLYIYGSVDNAFILTDYLGYNPDVDYNSGNLTPGIDFGTYPLARTFSIGVKLSF